MLYPSFANPTEVRRPRSFPCWFRGSTDDYVIYNVGRTEYLVLVRALTMCCVSQVTVKLFCSVEILNMEVVVCSTPTGALKEHFLDCIETVRNELNAFSFLARARLIVFSASARRPWS